MKILPQESLLSEEFVMIKTLIAENSISPMGKRAILASGPTDDKDLIRENLSQCSEMIQILEEKLGFHDTSYPDVSEELNLIRIENSVLSEHQFLSMLGLLHASDSVMRFFRSHPNRFMDLKKITAGLKSEEKLSGMIEAIIDKYGTVKSDASPELSRLRKKLQKTRLEADKLYQTAISKLKKQGWTAAADESSRGGRRVIAVVAEQKRMVKGIVHDVSATGKTVFIEPLETININNLVQELEQEEKLEIYRILRSLSADFRPHADKLELLHEMLGRIDVTLSKARFAINNGASVPSITTERVMDLKQARHPLLLIKNNKINKETVPFDLFLDHSTRVLVVSGPNAGGKTVCMKTIGLLQVMVQSGIPVTANADSRFGIFDHLLVDIGDSQSIEYELSTYSSRLKHMKLFLDHINENSLFLIDEFGTGTDPNLGGALAEAILEELNRRKAFGVITTHYLNLKTIADKTEGLINGSMEFDQKSLSPKFRLEVGKPGSSYTFLVAERSGLPQNIVNAARRKVPKKTLSLEKMLSDIESEKLKLMRAKAESKQKEEQLRALIEKYEHLTEKNSEGLKAQKEKYRKQEAFLKKESENRFKSFLKEWKKNKDKKEVVDKYYKHFVKKKTKKEIQQELREQELRLQDLRQNIKRGVTVRILDGSATGVVEKVQKDKVIVTFGDFRTTCEIKNLEIVKEG